MSTGLRRSSRVKAVSAVAEHPSTPKPKSTKGKKRALSDDEDETKPTPAPVKKRTAPRSDGTPRRADGRAIVVPPDRCVPGIGPHQVYVDPKGTVYDAMLNQTNVDGNNNKFYILQLILDPSSPPTEPRASLFTRWGRVGETGASQMKGPWPVADAVAQFGRQFKAKTGIEYARRKSAGAKKGKYTWLEKEYEDAEADDQSAGPPSIKKRKTNTEAPAPPPESKLPPEIQALVRFLFNKDYMHAHLAALNYDVRKQPLGKLAQSTILQGFQALKDLAEVIAEPDGEKSTALGGLRTACATLTSRYYTVIPHVFGRRIPTVIDHDALVRAELDLVSSLSDMALAAQLDSATRSRLSIDASFSTASSSSSSPASRGISASAATPNPAHPLDANFASLDLKSIAVVEHTSAEFAAIAAYARDTNEDIDGWHVSQNMQVLEVFRIERKGEEQRWINGGWANAGEKQRLLLWHGSRASNFVGILKQGLRIAPPEAPATGYEFGKGVYFGDMLGISANYTHASLSGNTGLLLLCEVVAQPYHEAYEFDFQADQTCKKNGKVATKALGKMQHEDWADAGEKLGRDDLRGVLMPGGHAKDLSSTFPRPSVKCEDNWNEYIAYDVSQIRMRYLLQVRL
uniref:Poly [ADP-ribose] polymerase n=1 Tax=Schizophyllum commune (strain H4-8 / FGSC 9210) TaxID=578458 RepID=D8PU00_SCHCM